MAKKEIKKEYSPEDLARLESKILEIAEKMSDDEKYELITTLNRYKVQVKILEKLKEEIESSDMLVEKEYVKGRPNISIHPAINEFNKTSSAANGTVATMVKIICSSATRQNGKMPASSIYEFLNS